MTGTLREKLLRGDPTLGCFVGLGSPAVTELLASVGFDWLVLEAEHTPLGISEIEHMLRACGGSETAAIVRVPQGRPDVIQLALDAGADGVLVPMVRTAEEAAEIVAVTKFPPTGSRSFGPLRASRYYTRTRDYFRRANDEVIVALILETPEAVTELEAIAAVPGVDAIYMGPKDLALGLGIDPFGDDPRLEEIASQLVAAASSAGIAAGNGAGSPSEVAELIERGFSMLGYGPDYRLLARAAQAGVAAFREIEATRSGG